MAEPAQAVTVPAPAPKRKPKQKTPPKPRDKEAKNPVPKFLRDNKLAKEDQHLLKRLMLGHGQTAVSLVGQLQGLFQRSRIVLSHLIDTDESLLTSGLLTEEEKAELNVNHKRLGDVLLALKSMLRVVDSVRSAKIEDLSWMEDALAREERRQRRETEEGLRKAAAEKRAATKQGAEVQYVNYEEPGSPTINLDPTLLAQATRAIRKPKPTQKPEIENTGRSVGKVIDAEV